MSPTNVVARVASVVRAIEVEAAAVDPEIPYEQRKHIPDFYSLCRVADRGGVPSPFLRARLLAEFDGLSESAARTAMSEAVKAGTVLRTGAGSDTRYSSLEAADEREEGARNTDATLLLLGQRALDLGLAVSFRSTAGYGVKDYETAAKIVREGRGHLRKVELESGLSEVVAMLEQAKA